MAVEWDSEMGQLQEKFTSCFIALTQTHGNGHAHNHTGHSCPFSHTLHCRFYFHFPFEIPFEPCSIYTVYEYNL